MVAKTILPLNMTGTVFNKVDNMRATLIALLMTIASQAGAGCGNLCDNSWWETATEADVQLSWMAGHRCTGLLRLASLQTSKPYWTLVQTSWRGMRMAIHRCTGLLLGLALLQTSKPC